MSKKRHLTNNELKRTFLLVARKGSLSGAARELNLTVPGVKYRIEWLEKESGQMLFVRGRWGMTLTAVGQATVDRLGGSGG